MDVRPLIVPDVNLLVSGTIISGHPPSQIMQAWENNELDLATSELILEDLARVLMYPKVMKYTRLGSVEQETFLKAMRTGAKVVAGTQTVHVSPDPDDNKVFACALEAQADYIVSGDEKHVLPVGTFQGIPVVRPRAFLDIFENMKRAA